MKVSSKIKKAYRVQGDRTTQEQIRKRRHNLFKRLKEFNDRYEIDIWLTMRMPSGRIYIFATNPDEPVPVVHKTPADYVSTGETNPAIPLLDPPALPFLDLPFTKANKDSIQSEPIKDMPQRQMYTDKTVEDRGSVPSNLEQESFRDSSILSAKYEDNE
ncbi:unnamed protein product [Aspergillus oryzae]|uniref:Unnamed protein product n=1 Tax=Aspergillus oryzae TaxID=5062 RepID=A0AAN5C4F0_ASPOZ|nr:unnamed protein product [Aspergillus oryzae]